MQSPIEFTALRPEHFDEVIELGNHVHGDNYLSPASLDTIYQKGLKNGLNASLLAWLNGTLAGFRLTYAPGNWQPDRWCTTHKWPVTANRVCYFKCNTVQADLRGRGIGSELLKRSIAISRRQGAHAGLAHLWVQSPGNSAQRYFRKAGGDLVKVHPSRWNEDCVTDGYVCTICGDDCHCDAAEMILTF